MTTSVISWPAPAEEIPSPDYTLDVDGVPVFVYQARVRAEILQHAGLWTHKHDCTGERASFAIFDITQAVMVTVRPTRPFRRAAVLPARAAITPEVGDGGLRFTVDHPQHLTIALDDDSHTVLHLFISAPETDVPQPDDANIIYFGPGTHEVDTVALSDGQTLYLAGGAVVKGVLRPGETGRFDEKWQVTFYDGAVIDLHQVAGVRVCGRGILDGSLVPHPGRNLIRVHGAHDVRIEGIMLRDAPNWNIILQQSQQVQVDNVRLISGRLNSDGINSVNSRGIRISRCFVRNHDDSIVVKTLAPNLPAEDIRVSDCVIWNDWGYALGATYETLSPIRQVSFTRCDILCSRHWCLGVHVSDSATVRDITFTDIQIAHLVQGSQPDTAAGCLTTDPKLLRMVIQEDCWGHDAERGQICRVVLDDIVLHGDHILASELYGYDADHAIRDITLRNVRVQGQPPLCDAEALRLTCNAYVHDVQVLGETDELLTGKHA